MKDRLTVGSLSSFPDSLVVNVGMMATYYANLSDASLKDAVLDVAASDCLVML